MFDVCHASRGEFSHVSTGGSHPVTGPWACGAAAAAARHSGRVCCTPTACLGKTSETHNLKVIWDVYVGPVRWIKAGPERQGGSVRPIIRGPLSCRCRRGAALGVRRELRNGISWRSGERPRDKRGSVGTASVGKARNPGDKGCTQSLPSWGALFVLYLCAWVPGTAQKASQEGLMFRGESRAPVRSSILKARLNNFEKLITWSNATCRVLYRFTSLFRHQSHLCWLLSSGTKLLKSQNVLDTTLFPKEYLSGAGDRAPLSFHPGMFHMFNKTRFSWNYSIRISKLFQKNKCKLGRIQYLKFCSIYLFLYSSFIQIFAKSANQSCLGNS